MTPLLDVRFFSTSSGKEPVRVWLSELPGQDRKTIGEDIKTVQFGWPLGMPLVRKLEYGLWEIRVRLDNRIARLVFTVNGNTMTLLHGFIKKQQATPQPDLALARDRLRQLKRK